MKLMLIAILATTLSVPAYAGEMDDAQSFDLLVNGSIAQHCALGSVPNMDFGNLEREGLSIRTRVAFDCNIPFTMVIRGEQGALTHTTMPNGQGPYSGQLPYSVGVKMPVRHPSPRTIDRSFNSRQIQAGGTVSSHGGIATDGMVLAIELGTSSGEAGLLAGNYSETITITVSPL